MKVSVEEARRIAVRAQALDGSAAGVLDTVQRLGRLQLDPIATVAPPQHLVLWSRLGSSFDPAELDRLLWEERRLFEWNAFIWPLEALPILKARMSRPRTGTHAWERRSAEFLKQNARFRRHVLKELERRGPLLSRELEGDSVQMWESDGWYGNRGVAVMLDILHGRGEVAVVGRRGKQRLWGSPTAGTRSARRSPRRKRTGVSPSCVSARSASGSRGASGRRIRTRSTARSRTARRSSPPSTG